jgi:hypothetical protein
VLDGAGGDTRMIQVGISRVRLGPPSIHLGGIACFKPGRVGNVAIRFYIAV